MLVIFIQVNPLVVVTVNQVILFALATLIQVILLVLVMLSLTILFIVILFVQVNLFVCHRYPIYTWNVLPGKLFRTNHTCSINSLSTQQIFLIILLSLLTCSVDYKYIIIMINNFVNLFLAMIILLTKLT